jgi:hypothetical protein
VQAVLQDAQQAGTCNRHALAILNRAVGHGALEGATNAATFPFCRRQRIILQAIP